MLTVDPHPLLDLRAFVTTWPEALASIPTPAWLDELASLEVAIPELPPPDAAHVSAVRSLLRHGGFKPSGRSKPCSEYIRAAAGKGAFPQINVAVDATNLAALHGALPVSTVDLDRVTPPLRVGIAAADARYVFNPGGQEIALGGLLCLHDALGPCANAVKDAQRSKTTDDTKRTLTLIWGTKALPGRADGTLAWHAGLCRRLGGAVEGV